MRDELPHSLAVVIDEVIPREGSDPPMIDVYAIVYVERDSQKGIIIGHRGSRLKAIGTQSRGQIERLLGCRVYLDLRESRQRLAARSQATEADGVLRFTV